MKNRNWNGFFSTFGTVLCYISHQTSTNCMHGCNGVRNVHANGVTIARKFVHVVDTFVKLIWIYQCVIHFFCPVLGCLPLSFIVLSCLLLRCVNFLFTFDGSRFCSRAINETSFSQSKRWYPFILLWRLQFMYSLKN